MIVDNYCYDCDDSECKHVVKLLGTCIHRQETGYGQAKLEVWDNGKQFTLRFRYDSDVCMEEFIVPHKVFE